MKLNGANEKSPGKQRGTFISDFSRYTSSSGRVQLLLLALMFPCHAGKMPENRLSIISASLLSAQHNQQLELQAKEIRSGYSLMGYLINQEGKTFAHCAFMILELAASGDIVFGKTPAFHVTTYYNEVWKTPVDDNRKTSEIMTGIKSHADGDSNDKENILLKHSLKDEIDSLFRKIAENNDLSQGRKAYYVRFAEDDRLELDLDGQLLNTGKISGINFQSYKSGTKLCRIIPNSRKSLMPYRRIPEDGRADILCQAVVLP